MSEYEDSVIRVDPVSAADAVRLADSAVLLLVTERIVVANDQQGDLWQPSPWIPGPGWRDVTERTGYDETFPRLAHTGVDIVVERTPFMAVENMEPSRCGHCGMALDEATYFKLIEEWWHTEEPMASCRSCGWNGLLADWPNEWPSVVGRPAVTFNNWPRLLNPFVEQMRGILGGRTVFVAAHY